MSDRNDAYAEAIVTIGRGEQALGVVEDELLTIARAIDANEQLRSRLTDSSLPVAQRLSFVEAEALNAAHPATRAALAMLIAAGRAGDVTAVARRVAEQAAAERNRELAEVTVAVPLDEARVEQLKAALERATGKQLEVKVHVDPSVVGGVRARIGDTVIDGSLARRFSDVRARLTK